MNDQLIITELRSNWFTPSFAILRFRLLYRHLNTQIITLRRVVAPTAVLVDAINTDAVEQVAVVGRLVDQWLAGKQVAGDCWNVLWSEVIEFGGIAVVIGAVGGEGECDVHIALGLFHSVKGPLNLFQGGEEQPDQNVSDCLTTFRLAREPVSRAGRSTRKRHLVGKVTHDPRDRLLSRLPVRNSECGRKTIVGPVDVAERWVPVDAVAERLAGIPKQS